MDCSKSLKVKHACIHAQANEWTSAGGGGSTKQEFVHKIGCPIYTNIHILESNDVTGDICT